MRIQTTRKLGQTLGVPTELKYQNEGGPGHCFAGNGLIEEIVTLIEQRATLTLERA